MFGKIFIIAYFVFIFGVLVLTVVSLKKNDVTCMNQIIIAHAIHAYHLDRISKHVYEYDVTYDDMESYDDTFKRWWDWGYEHILPPDKFAIIEPFIKEGK